MTQEDKRLLLIDLCARLLYGVKGRYCLYDSNGNLTDFGSEPQVVEDVDLKNDKIWTDETVNGYHPDEFKPFLRPISSMTEEEEDEYWYKINDGENVPKDFEGIPTIEQIGTCSYIVLDWLNEHHFDYRGLIEKGLALEATEGMYQ